MQITLKTLQQQTFHIDIDPEETSMAKCSMSYLRPCKDQTGGLSSSLLYAALQGASNEREMKRKGLVAAISTPSQSVV